ncbi:MAG: hypothetical protein ACRC68_09035 [Clostridium sp.]
MSKKKREADGVTDGLTDNEKVAIAENENQQVITNQDNSNNQIDSSNNISSNFSYTNNNCIDGANNQDGTCTDNCLGCTGENGSADPTKVALDQALVKIAALTASLNSVQQNVGSLYVGGEDEKIFYDRKVRPLVDMLYFLTQSAQGAAITAQNMQANAYSKKKQIRLPIDLSYEIIKEAYCVFETLKRRNAIYRHIIEKDIKKSGCLNEKYYKSSFCDLEEDYLEELQSCYNSVYND